MKKFLAVLLVVVMIMTCFSGCSSKKGTKSDLGGVVNSVSKFYEAEAFKQEMDFSLGIKFDEPILSQDSLNALLGENAAMMTPILSLFVKDKYTVELPLSMKSVSTKEGDSQVLFSFGKGDQALSGTMIAADGDVFLDMKSVYNWLVELLEPVVGSEAPAWPYQNAYVSMMDLLLWAEGFEGGDYMGGDITASPVSFSAEQGESSAGLWAGIGMMAGMDSDMITAVIENIIDAIPKQSLQELLNIVESILKDSEMLSTKDGYVTITITGEKLEKLPEAVLKAVDGKLAPVLDSIFNGIRNSENSIIASMLPDASELNGREIEDSIVEVFTTDKEAFLAGIQAIKDSNFEMGYAIKAGKTAIDCNLSIQCDFDAEGLKGTFNLSGTVKTNATKDVTVRAPGNVLTETEISDFLSAFMQ